MYVILFFEYFIFLAYTRNRIQITVILSKIFFKHK